MYEEHFGLKSRPFGAKAEGPAVFVGPQQAAIMSNLTKGLRATDAVVTVTGPVGVGKTTIVNRALESISPGRMVAWVGRMQLAPDEVLDLLLAGFGVRQKVRGTIQKFSAFRRLLAERAATGAQVAIVVEDAQRIGIDALVEIEALTAADAGDSTSANIILMGQPQLSKMMASPDLARMNQRNRLRQKIEAFSEAEVSGYLKHCIREAGGDYDAIFDTGVSRILFKCSQGVPRVINTLCETAMTTAMQEGNARISAALMQKVAADAFEYEGTHTNPVLATEMPAEAPESIPHIENETPAAETAKADNVPDLINDTQPGVQQVAESPAEINLDIEATQTQKILATPVSDEADTDNTDEPGFTLDDALSVDAGATNLMPGITPNLDDIVAENPRPAVDPQLASDPTENIPTLSNSMRIDVEQEVAKAKTDDVPQDSAAGVVSEAPVAQTEPHVAEPERNAPAQSADTRQAPEPVTQPVIEDTNPDAPAPAQKPAPTDEPAPVTTASPVVTPPATEQVAPSVASPGGTPPVTTAADTPAPVVEAPDVETPDIEAPDIEAPVDDASNPVPTENAEPINMNQKSDDAWSDVGHDADAPDIVETSDESPPPLMVDTSDLPDVATEVAAPQTTTAEKAAEDVAAPEPPPAVEAQPLGTEDGKRLPDIDALEKALDAAKKGDLAASPESPPEAGIKFVEEEQPPSPNVPEITLDDELPKEPVVDEEMLRVAEQIGRAHSLEDVNDVMAETIFGSQALDEIAAAVVANPPEDNEASPVMLEESEVPEAANDAQDPAKPEAQALSQSAAERLDMVKALNNGAGTAAAGTREDIELGSTGSINPLSEPRGPQPEPIENQINTSMTQTLKALSSAQAIPPPEPEEEKKSGGLFSRFRKSS